MSVVEVREQLVDVVDHVSRLPCACVAGGRACLACRAAEILVDVRARGLRLRRWRNDLGTPVQTVHVAGEVQVQRAPRRSCPGYISDRWQECSRCGTSLTHGRWALFYEVGELVAILPGRAGGASLTFPATGAPAEVPCWRPPAATPARKCVHTGGPGEPRVNAGRSCTEGGRMPVVRYVGYVRVASDQTDSAGLADQKACRAWIRGHRHKLVEICTDVGPASLGATAANRTGLAAAMAHVASGRADGIVVPRLDQLADDVVLQETILAEVRRYEARLHSCDPTEDAALVDDPADPTRAMVRSIHRSISSYERDLLLLRLRVGQMRHRQDGGWVGGRPPYGFQAVRGELVPLPEETGTVDLIVQLHAQGYSTRSIGAELTKRGIHSRAPHGQWRPATISAIIRRGKGIPRAQQSA